MSKLVYTGICDLEDKKPGAILREIREDGSLGDELIFIRKALNGASIGHVYEVERASVSSWKMASRRYVGRYDDAAAVAEWQLTAKVKQAIEDSLKAERAAARELPAAFEYMEPLRKIYRKQLPNGRRALEVLLLEYLRRPG